VRARHSDREYRHGRSTAPALAPPRRRPTARSAWRHDRSVLHTRRVPQRYVLEGCPAIFWLFGSDPELFAPAPAAQRRRRVRRQQLRMAARVIAAIEREGIHVEAFGAGLRTATSRPLRWPTCSAARA
jgi:hypothetical protein